MDYVRPLTSTEPVYTRGDKLTALYQKFLNRLGIHHRSCLLKQGSLAISQPVRISIPDGIDRGDHNVAQELNLTHVLQWV